MSNLYSTDLHFHDLFNHFPHWFLCPTRPTIPISLVYVFVAIARRLGFEAGPLGLPFRVVAQVPSPGHGPYGLIIDVYGSDTDPVLSHETDIPQLLLRAGIQPTETNVAHYLRQMATADQMLLRATRNIFGSFHMLAGPAVEQISPVAQTSAIYAAFTAASMIVPQDTHSAARVATISHSYPLDSLAIVLDAFAPSLQPAARSVVSRMVEQHTQEDHQDAMTVHRRRDHDIMIRYFVGAMFRHVRYGYTGAIVGWDPVCSESEDWIEQMQVDRLYRGRTQPFYRVVVTSGPGRCESASLTLHPTLLNAMLFRRRRRKYRVD
jgi:F-box protein 21